MNRRRIIDWTICRACRFGRNLYRGVSPSAHRIFVNLTHRAEMAGVHLGPSLNAPLG